MAASVRRFAYAVLDRSASIGVRGELTAGHLKSELPADTDPRDLDDDAGFSAMIKGHGERFERITAFLDRNGPQNTYTHGDGGAAFDARLATLDLPASMPVWDRSDDGQTRYRLSRLRERITTTEAELRLQAEKRVRSTRELRVRLRTAEKLPSIQRRPQLDAMRAELEAARKQLAAVERRVAGIERRAVIRIGPFLRRRTRKPAGGDSAG
ncbi:hypothetical protein ABZT03_01420 [Streptomyces sp. NPDC005574]|uniref:hypothetical protein n=1 Tax=Streptomyces sp. NPDC005574 TaxID=3156891 RepID=UPI0033B0D9BA